jgi:hypothetical protein
MMGLRAAPELRKRVERWAAGQPGALKLSEALRRLVEVGLEHSKPRGRHSRKDARKASAMAGREVDRVHDKSATPDQRAKRRRRLLEGPTEFRSMRKDHAKA